MRAAKSSMKGTEIQLKPRKSTLNANGGHPRKQIESRMLNLNESVSSNAVQGFGLRKAFAHAFLVTFRYILSSSVLFMGDFVTIQ